MEFQNVKCKKNFKIQFGTAMHQGGMRTQQDRLINLEINGNICFGVFDGHGRLGDRGQHWAQAHEPVARQAAWFGDRRHPQTDRLLVQLGQADRGVQRLRDQECRSGPLVCAGHGLGHHRLHCTTQGAEGLAQT